MTANIRAVATRALRSAERAAALPPVIAALLRPEAFPHPAEEIVLHETHTSWVILAGSFAYKIK